MSTLEQDSLLAPREETGSLGADFYAFLSSMEPDELGNITFSPEDLDRFGSFLAEMGITARPLTDAELAEHVDKVKTEIASGEARSKLLGSGFVNDKAFSEEERGTDRKLVSLPLDRPIYIDPSLVISASNFDSWMGRGVEGGDTMADRQTGEKRTSLETIFNYASRPTPLPAVWLQVLVQTDGKIAIRTENDHRAAAAKLRGEPLAANSLTFYFAND